MNPVPEFESRLNERGNFPTSPIDPTLPPTPFQQEFEASLGQSLPPFLSTDSSSSLSLLCDYIGTDPTRAISFFLHILVQFSRTLPPSSSSYIPQIYESQLPETRIRILERILRWHLGFQNLTDDTRSVICSLHFQNYSVLDILSKYPEFTAFLFQNVISTVSSDIAYPLLTHFYRSPIATECPEIFADLGSDVARLRGLIADGTIALPAFTPIVIEDDSQNPRSIKFGGDCPHSPDGQPVVCPECNETLSHVMSIYVPLLPLHIQEFFREDDRELLIVVLFCANCYQHFTTRVFRGEEINGLIMAPDAKPDGHNFNEPRLVVDWVEGISYGNHAILDELKIGGLHYHASDVFRDLIEPELTNAVKDTYVGGFPCDFDAIERPTPTSRVLCTLSESEAATGEWGDCGIAHVWMETGENYGTFSATFDCS
jgi:hypothetical protein